MEPIPLLFNQILYTIGQCKTVPITSTVPYLPNSAATLIEVLVQILNSLSLMEWFNFTLSGHRCAIYVELLIFHDDFLFKNYRYYYFHLFFLNS